MNETWKAACDKRKNEKLLELEAYVQEHFAEFQAKFLMNFDNMCTEIVRRQEEGSRSPIAYLEYTFLYHHFLRRQYVSEVRVYGEEWYFDEEQTSVGQFDVSFLFGKLDELWEELLSSRKTYVGMVDSEDVEHVILSLLPDFYSYLVSIIRFCILSAVEGERFQAVQRAEEFELNVGQYMAETESVYQETSNKDREYYLEWFRKRLEYEYAYEDLTGMDFSGEDLSEIDFRYSDLRNTVLEGTDFQNSMLYGSRFCNAQMKGADLRCCAIHEADFTGADLRDARFCYASGDAGMINREEWELVGFQGVNFQNADLREADFTKAELYRANFAGAKMEGAILEQGYAEGLDLSEEQRKGIVWK